MSPCTPANQPQTKPKTQAKAVFADIKAANLVIFSITAIVIFNHRRIHHRDSLISGRSIGISMYFGLISAVSA